MISSSCSVRTGGCFAILSTSQLVLIEWLLSSAFYGDGTSRPINGRRARRVRRFHVKRTGTLLDNARVMLRDLRHGFRVLLQAKGWTAVVVLSLAVGIGAKAAVFTAVDGLLLRKLPVTDPDSLVRLKWGGRNQMVNDSSDYGSSAPGPDGATVRATFSYPM